MYICSLSADNINWMWLFQIHTLENNRTGIAPSNLRTSEYYVVYYNFVFKTLFTELFPYCSLIYLNVSIYREIRKSVKLQQSMRCTHSQKEEIKSANVVVSYYYFPKFKTTDIKGSPLINILQRTTLLLNHSSRIFSCKQSRF